MKSSRLLFSWLLLERSLLIPAEWGGAEMTFLHQPQQLWKPSLLALAPCSGYQPGPVISWGKGMAKTPRMRDE